MPKQPDTRADESDHGDAPETPHDNAPTSESGSQPSDKRSPEARPKEYGGPKGPEPVRYGDWEKNGRCIDF